MGTATDYYGDETAATPTITAKNGATTWGTDDGDHHRRDSRPGRDHRRPRPRPAPRPTTNVTLGYQLDDQFGNATTQHRRRRRSTLSTSSTKGFFAATLGGDGTLGGTATVTFANGVGTATEYYGDETAATPTITAKNGATTWGTTTVTITAETTGHDHGRPRASGQTATVEHRLRQPAGGHGRPTPSATRSRAPT